MADFNQAIELDPNDAVAWDNRGLLNARSNNLPDALSDYNRAIALNPQYALAYYNRALLKANKLNDLPCAVADFGKVIALEPYSVVCRCR